MKITWDEVKNRANQRKHGLSFQEARVLLLSGVENLEIFDDAHSQDEDRFISIGPITRGIILVVWTERDETTVRIISVVSLQSARSPCFGPTWIECDE